VLCKTVHSKLCTKLCIVQNCAFCAKHGKFLCKTWVLIIYFWEYVDYSLKVAALFQIIKN